MWKAFFPHPFEKMCVMRIPKPFNEKVCIQFKVVFTVREWFNKIKQIRYHWSVQAIRRRTTGAGRMRFLKKVERRAGNNFREGTVAKFQGQKKE